jgi:hypothetical protein
MGFWLRAAIVLLTIWLTIDTAMPLVPGAFQFDPDDSVEVVSAPDRSALASVRRATAPPFDVALSVREAPAIRRRTSTTPRLRLVRRDRPRRHDHASFVQTSDPA